MEQQEAGRAYNNIGNKELETDENFSHRIISNILLTKLEMLQHKIKTKMKAQKLQFIKGLDENIDCLQPE